MLQLDMLSNILPGGSVASPGSINASTGVLNWDAGFHGTLNIESYATGCDGVENANPGVIRKNLSQSCSVRFKL